MNRLHHLCAGETVLTGDRPLISARNVHKYFADNHVLRGIDLDVYTGEVVVVLGPSGSGKSTFLRCINHLEEMDEGYIMMGDEQIGYQLRERNSIRCHPVRSPGSAARLEWFFSNLTFIPT